MSQATFWRTLSLLLGVERVILGVDFILNVLLYLHEAVSFKGNDIGSSMLKLKVEGTQRWNAIEQDPLRSDAVSTGPRLSNCLEAIKES